MAKRRNTRRSTRKKVVSKRATLVVRTAPRPRKPRPPRDKTARITGYEMCALNPFTHGSPSAFPDGSELPTITLENRTIQTVTLTGSNTCLTFFCPPSPGSNLYYQQGTVLPTLGQGTYGWTSQRARYSAVSVSGIASQFRTVSLAVRILPIEAPMNRKGVAYATRVKAETSITPFPGLDTTSPTPKTLLWRNYEPIAVEPNRITAQRDSIMGPFTQPLWMTGSLRNRVNSFKNINQITNSIDTSAGGGAYLCITSELYGDGTTTQGPYYALDSQNGKFDGAGIKKICATDPDYTPVLVALEGLPLLSSYVVEVRHCLELVPHLGSDWAMLAQEPPRRNEAAINRVLQTGKSYFGDFVESSAEMLEKMMHSLSVNPVIQHAAAGLGAGLALPLRRMARPPNTVALN